MGLTSQQLFGSTECLRDRNDNILSSEAMRVAARQAQKIQSSREPQDTYLDAQNASHWVLGNQGSGVVTSNTRVVQLVASADSCCQ